MNQATQTVPAGNGKPEKAKADNYVRIEGIRKEFDGFVAVDDVSLSIRKGEIFALLGASGCGKSTLLRMLAGFEKPTAGEIILDGQSMNNIPPYDQAVNMMFQSYALFPHMTVEQNVAFGPNQKKMPKDEVARRVEEMLALVQMSKFAKRKPHQLSGGQQQRVALARAVATSPKLLLLDEPMAALDKKLRSQMQIELVNIVERLNVTCIMVTHDQEEAMTMAHRVAVMDAGRIRQVGTPDEIYEQPNSRFTAEFIGSVNLFEGRIGEDETDHVTILSPQMEVPIYVGHGITGYDGMSVSFAIRPEKVHIDKDEPAQKYNKVRGVIEEIAYFGSHSVYHVRLAGGTKVLCNFVNMKRWASESFTWNDVVWLSWDDNSGVVLTS
ncbi:polyamine ABC transporter ATP-binding protein [Arenimonas sp. GDDSR-1]|uniref:ABC transporter ATP-binding protein n=1 Tax=Arenimonas sp. GDDSR-1 TaxID=2950125 RepID=UPI00262EB545|nr:polyamine ABC transporter ATP-binding protein [Arenimonas sp. GDDSR-1]